MAISQGRFRVAEDGGILCCACLNGQGAQGEIHALIVAPEHKRRGIRRALVLDADPEAVAVSEAISFVTVGEKPSGSIPGRRLPHMRIVLWLRDIRSGP